VLEAVLDRLVGEHIELLLLLSLHVLIASSTEDVDQARTPDRGRDDLARQGDIVKQVRQLAGCLRVAVFLVEDKAFDRRYRCLQWTS
jgi:hypothetical protein